MVSRKGSLMVSRSQAQPITQLAHLDLRQVLQSSRSQVCASTRLGHQSVAAPAALPTERNDGESKGLLSPLR